MSASSRRLIVTWVAAVLLGALLAPVASSAQTAPDPAKPGIAQEKPVEPVMPGQLTAPTATPQGPGVTTPPTGTRTTGQVAPPTGFTTPESVRAAGAVSRVPADLPPARERVGAGQQFRLLPRFGASVFSPAQIVQAEPPPAQTGPQQAVAGQTPGAPRTELTPPAPGRLPQSATASPDYTAGQTTPSAQNPPPVRTGAPQASGALSPALAAQGVAVPVNYVLGGGDTLDLRVWSRGRVQHQATLTVSNDGFLFLPVAGRLSVAGQTLQQLREAVSRTYAQLYDTPEVTLVLASQRAVDVYVLGDVTMPGKYNLAGMVTVFGALYAAGGPSESGSYRQVRLERVGQKPQFIDLYDYLLRGERKGDVLLEAGDTLFVPPARLEVGVAGEVRRPGRYELTAATSLAEVLDMAGGLGPQAYAPAIEVWRTGDHRGWQLVNLDASESARTQLQDGDLVVVKPLLDIAQQTVIVRGAVNRPGSYAFSQGMTMRQLLALAEGPADGANVDQGVLWRLSEDMTYNLQRFSAREALVAQSGVELALKPRDIVYVPTREEATVSITGEVLRPGTYPFGVGMRVADLVLLAGGLKPGAFTPRADLTRWLQPTQEPSVLAVDLQGALAGEEGANALLQRQDVLVVKLRDTAVLPSSVHIDGFVQSPGSYPYFVGMKVSDLIFAAGSPLPQATGIECARGRTSEKAKTQQLKITGTAEKFRVEPDLELGPDDRVSVQGSGRFVAAPPAVLVKGEVQTQGAYALLGGGETAEDTVWSVLQRAGGLLSNADPSGMVIYRGLPEIFMQMRDLNQMLSNYNRESLATQEKLGAVNAAAQEAMTEAVNRQLAQVFSSPGSVSVVVPPRRLQLEQSVQAIPVDGERLLKSQGKQANVDLAPGDVLTIPKHRDTVAVVGAVARPGAIPYRATLRLGDYINQAGGLSQDAAIQRALVLATNGSVRLLSQAKLIKPGEVIIIPSRYVVETRKTEKAWESVVRALSTAAVLWLNN